MFRLFSDMQQNGQIIWMICLDLLGDCRQNIDFVCCTRYSSMKGKNNRLERSQLDRDKVKVKWARMCLYPTFEAGSLSFNVEFYGG